MVHCQFDYILVIDKDWNWFFDAQISIITICLSESSIKIKIYLSL